MQKRNSLYSKSIVLIIIGALFIQPSVFPADKNEITETSGPGSIVNKYTFCAALGGAAFTAFATWYSYYASRYRQVKTNPTDMNFTTFGNEKGYPIIYSHGFGGNLSDIYYYLKHNNPFLSPNYLIDPENYLAASFNYPDSTKMRSEVKYDQVSLGQVSDMNRLADAITKFNKDKMIAFGISRGASTIINYMGTRGNKAIKAIVLEAPFATIPDVLSHFLQQHYVISYIPLVHKIFHLIASALFPQYDRYGIQPIDAIEKIDKNIPIILIHSKEDETTPINSSRQLYIKRKQLGCNNVYLVELERGRHVYCLREEMAIGRQFQNAIQSFFKKYEFPHDEALSNVDLSQYQPSIEEVEKRMISNYHYSCTASLHQAP